MSFISELLNAITRAGNLRNFISNWARNNFRPFWMLLQRIPVLKDILNKYYISSSLANYEHTIPRIPRYTLKHDYMSFDVLYDESRTTYSRLLKRDPEFNKRLPSVDKVASLFEREEFTPETNRNLTVLIAYYAQWFSHMFLNTHPENFDEANQPLGINMSMLYGSNKEIEKRVRLYQGGLLRATKRFGSDGDEDEWCRTEFPEIVDSNFPGMPHGTSMFNMPLERANIVPGFAAIHIVFFRRHQYIAKKLAEDNPEWDDERLFQTTKLIMSLTLLRITMHDYVARSLQSSHIKIKLDPLVKQSRMWRMFGPSNFPPCNSIQIEFNVLYRWHQFIPDAIKIVRKLPEFVTESASSNMNSKDEAEMYDVEKYECDELKFPANINSWPGVEWNSADRLLETDDALERVLFSAATQRAGKLELMNTNKWLVKHVITPSLQKTRAYQLASYNDYREYMGFSRITKFEQMTSNPEMCRKLRDVYGHPDNVEYYPGIFAEDKDFGGVHGPFLATIGVAMTFLAIHSSRIFESGVVSEESLTKRGLQLFEEIEYLSDLTKLHTKLGDTRIRFTMPEDAQVPPSSKVLNVQSVTSNGNHPHAE